MGLMDIVGSGGSEALDPDEVDRIASAAGVSSDDAKSGVASMIPGVVDRLSPVGSLHTGGLATAMKGLDHGSILGR